MERTRTAGPALLRLSLFAAAALAVGLAATTAQPPEVEDPKGKVKKKVVVDDPDTPPAAAGKTPDARLEEIERAAAAATHPAVKAFLARFVVPFDRATPAQGAAFRVQPIPLFRTDRFPAEYGVVELGDDNVPKPPRNVTPAEVKRYDYFEEVALADVDQWLKQKPFGAAPGPADLSADDQLAAAEKVLAAALRFHDYARTHPFAGRSAPIRPGKSWDVLHKPLADRLREVRLRQLQRAVAGADWQRARQFGTSLMAAYPKDAGIAQEVAAARVAEAQLLLKSKAHADQVKARELLDEFDARFPGGGGDALRALRKELTDEAARLYERARAQKAAGNLTDARNELDRAEALDPTVAGLRELKRDLGSGYSTLHVGVRQFPERMSPATARFDSEQQAVELLFEGLLEDVPDPAGTRYRPGAALGFPTVFPGGRDLLVRQVPRQADGTAGFDAHDVVETVKLLRARPHLWAAVGLPWIDDVHSPGGGGSLRVAFAHGHPDPRSLLTVKAQPGRWLAERGKAVDDPDFAARPFGTGPYRIHALPDGSPGPRELVFVDNPAYGRGRDRGPAHIREVRFVEAAKLVDPLDDFRRGRLHVLPDLTAAELNRALSRNGADLGGKGRVVVAATNRRVHILAFNHRRPPLQSRDLRKGLSLAIDREGILNDLIHAAPVNMRRFTAAMSGPFPPGSWAAAKSPTGQPVPLLNRDQAAVHLRRFTATLPAGQELKLSLAYPAGDPQAETVCDRIRGQVDGLFKDAADGRKVSLVLEPLDPRRLLTQVESEHRFDLAYVPFDYPDDWHPFGLAAFLDPAGVGPDGRDGRNVTGYLTAGTNADEDDRALGAQLAGLRQHRDFAGQLAPRAARIHTAFNDVVPFVPLWQLDRYTLVSSALKPFVDDGPEPAPAGVLDPTRLFHNVARWRLE